MTALLCFAFFPHPTRLPCTFLLRLLLLPFKFLIAQLFSRPGPGGKRNILVSDRAG